MSKVCILSSLLIFGLNFPLRADTSMVVDLADLEARLQRVMRETPATGAAVGVILADGRRWIFGLGGESPAARIDANTPFRLGSISKTLTALGVMALVEDGAIALDTPVLSILPDLPLVNRWERLSPVRVGHLLEHTAGIDNLRPDHFYALGEHALPLVELVRQLGPELLVRWRPGERWSYSSAGYAVLGLVVERVTAEPLERFVRRRILQPAGWRTFAGWSAGPPIAVPASKLGDGRYASRWPVAAWPAGNANGSVTDLLTIARLLLDRGRAESAAILRPATVESMERPTSSLLSRAGLEWLSGRGLYPAERRGWRFFGHGGDLPGYHAEFFYCRELGVAYAVATAAPDGTLRNALRDAVVAALVPQPRTVSLQAVLVAEPSFAGWYRAANPRNAVLSALEYLTVVGRIDVAGSTVTLRPLFGDDARFVHVGNNLLREPEQAFPRAMLLPRSRGGPAVWIDWLHLMPTSTIGALAPLLAFVAATLVVLVDFPLAAWQLLRRQRNAERRSGGFLDLARLSAGCGVIAFAYGAAAFDLSRAHSPTPAAVLLWAGPWLLTAGAGATAWLSFVGRRAPVRSSWVRFVSLCAAALAVSLWAWGLFDLRLWS